MQAESVQMIGRVLNDRYELRSLLGEGGMSVVFEAHDRRAGQLLALKLMKNRVSGPSLRRFVREFQAVSSLRHPNCIEVLEFGETDEFPFFTMELFLGHPVTTVAGRPASVIARALLQAATALDYVHARQIIHRDVKPSNLLVRVTGGVSGGEPSVEVKLLDFGLARLHSSPSSLTDDEQFLGTVKYCAPEQFGRDGIDSMADLYSLGLVCYESLTGVFPFEEDLRQGVQALIHAKQHSQPRDLAELRPLLPTSVCRAVMELLAFRPVARPVSTGGLREALRAAFALEDTSDGAPRTEAVVSESTHDRIVGRQLELEQGRRYLNQALNPHLMSKSEWESAPIPSVLFITGEPGIGKSRLMQELVELAHGRGAFTLEGRCFEGHVSAYQPFVEMLEQLLVISRRTGDSSGESLVVGSSKGLMSSSTGGVMATKAYVGSTADVAHASVRSLIEDYSAEILRIAPDLRRYLAGEAFRQVDLSRETNYVLRAIATLFVELSTLRGTLLCIEDLQWADPSTLMLLRQVASRLYRSREMSVESQRLAICCTVRSGNPQLQTLIEDLRLQRQAEVIHVEALTDAAARELIAAVLGVPVQEIGSALAEPVCRLCDGNPFFVRETIQSWRSADRLVRGERVWTVPDTHDDDSDWPESVREVVQRRLQDLSPLATRLLSVCAVIGSRIDARQLRMLMSADQDDEVLDALDELLERKLLRERQGVATLEFTHDLLRETAYGALSVSRRTALHQRVGELLESCRRLEEHVPPHALAEHFAAANDLSRACCYHAEAGEASLSAYAIDDAVRHLRWADTFASQLSGSDSQRIRLRDLLATAQSAGGEPTRAVADLKWIIDRTNDPVLRARCFERIGAIHFRLGEIDAGIEQCDRSLRELGLRRASSAFGAMVGGSLRMASLFAPFGRWFRGASGDRLVRAEIARNVYNCLTYLWAQSSVAHSVDAIGRQLVRAQQVRQRGPLADTYAQLAVFSAVFGASGIATWFGRRSLTAAGDADDAWTTAVADGALGCAEYVAGELADAESLLRKAVATLDRRGDSWYRMFFYHNLRHLYSVLADEKQERQCAATEMQIGESVHDPEGICWGHYGMANAFARCGRLDTAREHMQESLELLKGKTNIIVVPTALATAGFLHLQSGDYAAARAVLKESRSAMQKNFAFADYSIRCYPLLVEALLGPRWHQPGEISGKELRRAWRLSRWALFWGWRFPNYLSHAWRVRGRAAWVRGKPQTALGCFRRARGVAERIGARYDLARALLDQAVVDESEGERLANEGWRRLSEVNAVIPDPEAQTLSRLVARGTADAIQ